MANKKRLIDANALIDWLTKPTGFIRNCDDCPDIDCVHCVIEDAIKTAPTVDAEVLPCHVGDYVYYIKGGYYKEPRFCEVSRPCKIVEVSFKLKRNSGSVMCGFITDNGTRYSFNSIGKSVFLTKEEAEAALAKRRGDGNA